MKIEISNGELLDKLSILSLKLRHITDEDKLKNIKAETSILTPLCQEFLQNSSVYTLYQELVDVNTKLWDIEDKLREHETKMEFNKKFIEMARLVYITNDRRADIKKQINIITESTIVEEKSYSNY